MPVTVAVPVELGVNVTEQLPLARVQLGALRVPAAVPAVVKLTVPVGVMIVPGDVSVTVAVQVDAWLTMTGVVHDTAVELFLLVTVTVAVPELVAWLVSAL